MVSRLAARGTSLALARALRITVVSILRMTARSPLFVSVA
jgi:hypothetical protein